MGTSGITQVILNGKTKVAQYGQWDHYPSGQGVTTLKFLKSFKKNYESFKNKLKSVRFATKKDEQEWKDYYTELGANDSGYVSMDIADKFKQKYPLLTRDNGAGVLQMIMESNEKKIVLQNDSAYGKGNSGGFGCEGKYIIDFDKNVFESWDGTHDLLMSYQLDKLPTEKKYLSDCNKSYKKLSSFFMMTK